MEGLSFKNNYIQNKSLEVKKDSENKESFTALDKEKIKQDTVELGNIAKENANENIIFRTMRNFGSTDPKKTLISFACSIGTVIGVAILGNKLSKPSARLGNTVDEFLTGDNVVGKFRNRIVEFIQNIGENIKKAPKPKFVENAKKALENPMGPKWTMLRGFENGAKGLFSTTLTEIIDNALEKNKDGAMETLTKLLGNNKAKAEEIVKDMASMEKVKFADKLVKEIAQANNCNSPKALEEVFEKLSNGEFGEGLRNITMDKGGFIASWGPANVVNKILKKFTGKESSYLKGDLGDSLIKYAAIRGKLAKTFPAKLIQIIPPLVGDQLSNFVNDKSGFGVLLCTALVSNFNKLQDAPKEKKVSTALNDVATGSLSWLISMPLAYGVTYSLASLSKMEGKDILSKLTRGIGKFFAMGLNTKEVASGTKGTMGQIAKNAKGLAGGLMRFGMIMFVLSPFIGKKIEALCAKIFGKPYDPAEEQKAKQLEEQKKQVVPELGITQGELEEKIKNNPKALQTLQTNPELAQAVNKNPKLMLDLLDGKDIPKEPQKQQKQTQSPMLQNMINGGGKNVPQNDVSKNDTTNKADLFTPREKEKTSNEDNNETQKDTATYIPDSSFIAKSQDMTPEAKQEYDRLMSNADRVLKSAEKYI